MTNCEPISKYLLKHLVHRISGQVYKYWVGFVWRGGQRVRRYVIPKDPKTPAQLSCRRKFSSAVSASCSLSLDDRLYWEGIGVRRLEPLPWEQTFIQAYMLDLVDPATNRHIRNLQF